MQRDRVIATVSGSGTTDSPDEEILRLAESRCQSSLRGSGDPARRAPASTSPGPSPSDRHSMSPLPEAIAPYRVLRPRPSMNLSASQSRSQLRACPSRLALGGALLRHMSIVTFTDSHSHSSTESCNENRSEATYHRPYASLSETHCLFVSHSTRLVTNPAPKAISKGDAPV